MSFSNANNIVISGGTFINTHETGSVGSSSLALLSSKIASGAFHNSAERFDPPKCHPNTREAILQTIMNWLDDPAKLAQVMWIYGSAGVGKSAIAQSIAEMCFNSGKLVGSFFFGRGAPNRHTETLFISTLAYQLMQSLPQIRTSVLKTIEQDPQLFSLSLEDQMQKLIIGPLNSTVQDEDGGIDLRSRTATLIVIDGLDECDHSKAQRYVLDVLSASIKRIEIPVSILICCRPEQIIREAFNEEPLMSFTTRINLDNISDDTDVDIKTFLLSEFQSLKCNHPAKDHFPPIWPSVNEMTELILRSSGHFIYASTVIKYIGSRRHSPITRLSYILQQSIPATDTPFAALDALYQQILMGVDDLDSAFKIIATLLLENSSILPPTATSIELLHSFQPGMVKIALCDLHSIVHVPEGPEESLWMYHASFSDFLFDGERSGRFSLDGAATHAMLASAVLKLSTSSIKHFHTSVLLYDHYDYFRFRYPDMALRLQKELYAIDLAGLLSSLRDVAYAYWDELNRLGEFLTNLNRLPCSDQEDDLITHHLQFFVEWITLALSGPIRKFTGDSRKLKEANISIDAILEVFSSATSSLAATPDERQRIKRCCMRVFEILKSDIILLPDDRDSNAVALIDIKGHIDSLLPQDTKARHFNFNRKHRTKPAGAASSWSTAGKEVQDRIATNNQDTLQDPVPRLEDQDSGRRSLKRLFKRVLSLS
ncbi:hypothetical protein CVT25_011248 [Psilocybe cyanescens]|uniref:Nephrocystin 3-like N-terminal domain-containing protein n=1 Tax=Psilocybe cyanescens TaxID=93625 RepID=A0A409X113_PSICY|nr:hypothetical protein CVT25_011248 [Psilocybe cyanescens]